MLTQEEIDEIRDHLEKAQNPLFFFDEDNDGVCSFLLLRRFIGRGKGVAIKSFPDLNASYYRKVYELKPDYIFVLDKPLISKEFIEKAKREIHPLVWIDHHELKQDIDGIFYYNPAYVKENGKLKYTNETSEPISYACYKIAGRKEDVWLGVIGCISDHYLPDFYKDFLERYPELGKEKPASPFDVLYNSEIGKIAQILDFSMKDTTTNVVNAIKFLIDVKSPYDILEENPKTHHLFKRYRQINKKYQLLIKKARKLARGKLLFFQYGGDLSLSANIANQLIYEFPDKIVVVAYIKGDFANISLRGRINIKEMTLKAIEGLEEATGGGHKNATGAKVHVKDLPLFKKRIEEYIQREMY